MYELDESIVVSVSDSKDESIRLAVESIQSQYDNQEEPLNRPEVSLANGFLFASFLVLVRVCIYLIFKGLLSGIDSSENYARLLAMFAVPFIILLKRKSIVMWSVKVYQRFASEKLRNSCCFEPSCSNYMMQAVNKYGVIFGVYKTICRLLRCHYPNGGIDFP